MTNEVIIIAAVARGGAIGYRNNLLYHLPDDMRRFRELTTGHTVVMGRRTYESLPKGALPNRRNLVLSRQPRTYEGCEVYPSLREALASCQEGEKVFIIGGASVYKEALPLATRLELTEIDDTPQQADTFFPDYKGWQLTHREWHPADERHAVRFCFATYQKKPLKQPR